MPYIADTIIQFPVSGSGAGIPSVHMRVIKQRVSASLEVVLASTSPVMLVPANPNRVNLLIVNDSPSFCYIRYGSGSINSYTYSDALHPIDRGSAVRVPDVGFADLEGAFVGPIYAVWETASGSAKITQFFNS